MKDFTDQQLQDEMKEFLPPHPRYKAASKILEERRLAKEAAAEKKRQESMEQAERHHSDRQRLARMAALISAVGALASWVAFAVGRFLPQSQSSALEHRVKALEEQLNSASKESRSDAPTPVNPTESQAPTIAIPKKVQAPSAEAKAPQPVNP